MKFLIKSKRKHGNVEEFRWSRSGYSDDALMGIVDDHASKVNAFNDFAETFHIMNDIWLPMIDFDIHVIKSEEQLGQLMYD
jgi:hypothetical protein|tara:strand:+ start:249 stop:491 length:243 start_codon:yes stop_codon:yes gene_type:complete